MINSIYCCKCGKVIGELVDDSFNAQNPPLDEIMCQECAVKELKADGKVVRK